MRDLADSSIELVPFIDRPVGQFNVGSRHGERNTHRHVHRQQAGAGRRPHPGKPAADRASHWPNDSAWKRLSVNAVVDAAGVSKGTFFHHFRDRVSYLVALHRRFHDVLFEEVDSVIRDMPPGRDTPRRGRPRVSGQLPAHRGVKALLLEARGLLPLQEEVLRRNGMIVDLVAADFDALGWPHPRAVGRLWIAATAECALVETRTGRTRRCRPSRAHQLHQPPAQRRWSTLDSSNAHRGACVICSGDAVGSSSRSSAPPSSSP